MELKMDFFKCFPPDHLIQSEEELLATIHTKYKKNYYFVSINNFFFLDSEFVCMRFFS